MTNQIKAEEITRPKEIIYRLETLAQQYRVDIFKMIHQRGNGHWGGSSSLAEILTTLYHSHLKIDPENPDHPERDRVILSKGHAAPLLYTVLANMGFFPKDTLKDFRALGSILQGHPCMNKTPGVDMSTGALGHGVSVGVGMALAARIKKLKFRTFVIIGDGDLNEGETWEGFMAAAKFSPPKLFFLIDYNKVQLDGPSDKIMPLDPLRDKLHSFNINVADKIFDGHSVLSIKDSFCWMEKNSERPSAIIYQTIKGKGISFTENNHKWHGATIDDQSYKTGIQELEKELTLRNSKLTDYADSYA